MSRDSLGLVIIDFGRGMKYPDPSWLKREVSEVWQVGTETMNDLFP